MAQTSLRIGIRTVVALGSKIWTSRQTRLLSMMCSSCAWSSILHSVVSPRRRILLTWTFSAWASLKKWSVSNERLSRHTNRQQWVKHWSNLWAKLWRLMLMTQRMGSSHRTLTGKRFATNIESRWQRHPKMKTPAWSYLLQTTCNHNSEFRLVFRLASIVSWLKSA